MLTHTTANVLVVTVKGLTEGSPAILNQECSSLGVASANENSNVWKVASLAKLPPPTGYDTTLSLKKKKKWQLQISNTRSEFIYVVQYTDPQTCL